MSKKSAKDYSIKIFNLSNLSALVDINNSLTMLVLSTRRPTLGDRTFPVAAARACNSLPPQTRASSSLLTFQRETKSHLF